MDFKWLDDLGAAAQNVVGRYIDVKATLAGQKSPAVAADATPTAPTSPIQVATQGVPVWAWYAAGAAIVGTLAYLVARK